MRHFLGHLWRFTRPHQGRVWMGVLAGFVYAAGSGALLLAVKLVIDAIFPSEGDKIVDQLRGSRLPAFLRDWAVEMFGRVRLDARSPAMIVIIGTVPAAMMVRGAGAYLNTYWMNWVGAHVVHDIRVRLFAHLQRLSLDFFGTARTGDLQSRLTNDTSAIQSMVTTCFSTLAKEPLTMIFLIGYLFTVQRRLTLVALVVFPLVVLPVVIYGRKMRKAWKAAQTHTAELSDLMQETFTGSRVVKAYNLEGAVTHRFETTSRKIVGQFMRFTRASELPGPVIEAAGSVGVALMLVYVARLSGAEAPSAGDFTSFVGALFSIYQPVKNLSRFWGYLEQGRGAGERLFSLLDIEPTVVEPSRPVPLAASRGPIEFDHVTFGYAEKPAVRDVHLVVKPGEMVALVGASGSGKTTLTNLLLRFYDPQQGVVRISGVDLRSVATSDLRRQIAVVTQETILFNDTIRANIRLGRPEATDTEVEAAARAANAHEFIGAKSGGYDFVIGERGGNLSGGQRQRLAIARAILRDAPILVLDEATSALDADSERAVQTALETLMKGRTTLCIAHRLTTIQNADRIVVMSEGQIVEEGTHEALMASGGVYARMRATG